ncbi:MAG: peptide-methionine (S)-S-oxide reductase, partial [Polaribacter sp.]
QEVKIAYFASGCFWCVEAIFESVDGVEEAISGYAGGFTKNPTYQSIGTGKTGHAEAVAVYYNPKKVSFETLVKVFFGSHDPTTKNGQHPDYGTQYRSIAFYSNTSEKVIIEKFIKELNDSYYKGKIVTEVTELNQFFQAEDYHQNYEKLNPNNPYVKNVSVPRLNRFKKKFPELLTKGALKH